MKTRHMQQLGLVVACLLTLPAAAQTAGGPDCKVTQIVPMRLDAGNDILKGGLAADYNIIVRNVSEDNRRNVFREGPLEVYAIDEKQTHVCKLEQDMLQEPFAFVQNRYLYFAVIDASEVWLRAMDLKTCQIAWSSPVLTQRPKVAANTFVLDDKTYALNSATCLPEAAAEAKTQAASAAAPAPLPAAPTKPQP